MKRFTVFCVLALGFASLGFGFNPIEELSQWEIPRFGAPSQVKWENQNIKDAKVLGVRELQRFEAKYGGEWFYQVNRPTGTYHHIYGSGIDLGKQITTAEIAEAVARKFIEDNQGLFGVSNSDLVVINNVAALGKRAVIFQQTYKGLKVFGGRVHLVFTENGKLFEFGSDAYPGIDISPIPNLSEEDALTIAKEDMWFNEATDRVAYKELLILPVEIQGAMTYRLAYRFELDMVDPFGRWATYVDANTGQILWRENLIRLATYSGHSQGDVEWDSYCDGFTYDYPMRNMRIVITDVGTVYTNANGDFSISGGTGSKTISAEFRGQWVNVNRASGGDAVHTGTIQPDVAYLIDWSSANSLHSERDVFAYVNKEHDWLKAMDPSFTSMDYVMTATIERTDLYCPGNAWWDGSSINFCKESTTYGNTGRLADVIYHEYGHGITDFMYGANDPPSDMQEGNSDIVANFLTRESIIGLGFYLNNCTSGIRNSSNTLQYPCSGSGHYCGQVLAGFHWDSWQALLSSYPQQYADSVAFYTWHYGRKLGLPRSQPDQVYWTFVADDNDGNLSNGTPHYSAFCTGATNHGFTCPAITIGVSISHTPLTDTQNTTQPYQVLATITSTGGDVVQDSCKVIYRVNGGNFSIAQMTRIGSTDQYVGYIPAQQSCSAVEYYIYAADNAGNSAKHPSGAPSVLHSFRVGYEVIFEDDFETHKGWIAGLPDDDATTGQWSRCDPQGTTAQPEDDHTPAPGVNAYITDCRAGTNQGSYDVDNGKTTLRSPKFALSQYQDVALVYYRWYSNDTGADPGNDYWVVQVNNNIGSGWIYLENTKVSNRSWLKREFKLRDYITLSDSVQIQFVASDYPLGAVVEAGVDDFLLIGCRSSRDTIPPVVTVLDPNGGEVVIGGGGYTYEIKWRAQDDVGVVGTLILLSTDGGLTYPDTIVSGSLDSTYIWNVPDITSSQCRIKIVCRDAANNLGSDQSDADFTITGISGTPVSVAKPDHVVLMPACPSPFGSVVEIEFGLPKEDRAQIAIYAADGRMVAKLAEGKFPSGYTRLVWNGKDQNGQEVSPGIYFCRLQTAEKVLTTKMVLVR